MARPVPDVTRILLASILFVIAADTGLRPALVAQTPVADADPRIAELLAAISGDRLRATITHLASFHTRHSYSDASPSGRGIGAARQWILESLGRAHSRLVVQFDTHTLAAGQRRLPTDLEIRNVVAMLPGRTTRRVYIGAHYDSLTYAPGASALTAALRPAGSEAPEADIAGRAPGANDNGSGTALTMELARVFAASGIEFDATLVFAAWAGEEQGLYGATAHAQRLLAEAVPVEAVLNSDIVGNSRGGNGVIDAESVRVYADGPEDSMSRSLARYVARAASLYTPAHRVRPMARLDRFNRNSDHTPFSVRGFPAITFRESNEDFSRQHSAADTAEHVDVDYLRRNARVAAAAAASLALAPAAPMVVNDDGDRLLERRPSGYDATLSWKPSAGAVAYRIYWRETWRHDWQHQQLVGNVTTYTLPDVSIDDFVFGVAAVGPGGHESLIRGYVAAAAASDDVQLK